MSGHVEPRAEQRVAAANLFELLAAFEGAGFTRSEAFALVMAQWVEAVRLNQQSEES